MKNLLKNGFIRREELDFSDDGNRFQMYEYAGLLISKHVYQGTYYICIRVDYTNDLTYYNYKDKDWYELTDKFNGVKEVDVDDLKATIDIVAKGVEELREEIQNEQIDWTGYDNKALEELKEITEFLSKYRNVDLLTFKNDYEIKEYANYIRGLQRNAEIIDNLIERHDRYEYKRFKELGYVEFEGIKKDFYCKEILKLNKVDIIRKEVD